MEFRTFLAAAMVTLMSFGFALSFSLAGYMGTAVTFVFIAIGALVVAVFTPVVFGIIELRRDSRNLFR